MVKEYLPEFSGTMAMTHQRIEGLGSAVLESMGLGDGTLRVYGYARTEGSNGQKRFWVITAPFDFSFLEQMRSYEQL